MSPKSVHMSHPQPLPRNTEDTGVTVSYLRNKTWEELMAHKTNLPGSTWFTDTSVMVALLKNHMVITYAARELGYSGSDKVKRGAIRFRLNRMNCYDILGLFKMLIKAEKLTNKDITKCLVKRKQGKEAKAVKRINKLLCLGAVEKAGGNKKLAAKRLGISIARLDYWLQ